MVKHKIFFSPVLLVVLQKNAFYVSLKSGVFIFWFIFFSGSLYADEWKKIFNGKDFTGWNIYIKDQEKDTDLKNYFSVHDDMIHTYKHVEAGSLVRNGVIMTEKEFSHFRLRFEYKWGKKKFMPRLKLRRDAGLLFHCFEEDRSKWTPGGFPLSVECQVQEYDTGDLWLVGTTGTVSVSPGRGISGRPIYQREQDGGIVEKDLLKRVHRSIRVDKLTGWNRVEVEVFGDSAKFWINDQLVMSVTSLKKPGDEDGAWVSLDRGKIAFQCEAAEVYYRNIEIYDLTSEKGSGG